VSPLARLELSVLPVLVLSVIPIVPAAPDPLSTNVRHALPIFPFSHPDVVCRHAANPSSSIKPLLHARLVTRVVQAALLLGLVIVWHVRALLKFCKLDHVYLRIVMDPRTLFLDWAFVFLMWWYPLPQIPPLRYPVRRG
jgi:hypothetical protein